MIPMMKQIYNQELLYWEYQNSEIPNFSIIYIYNPNEHIGIRKWYHMSM